MTPSPAPAPLPPWEDTARAVEHFEPATSEGPYPRHPGWPEKCSAGEGIELERPIIHCPFWEPDAHHAPAADEPTR